MNATARGRSSAGKSCVITAAMTGVSTAAPIPIRQRAVTTVPAESARLARIDAAPKSTSPRTRNVLRP